MRVTVDYGLLRAFEDLIDGLLAHSLGPDEALTPSLFRSYADDLARAWQELEDDESEPQLTPDEQAEVEFDRMVNLAPTLSSPAPADTADLDEWPAEMSAQQLAVMDQALSAIRADLQAEADFLKGDQTL